MISNNSLCRLLIDCCENHSGCGCLCKNLKLIYFNIDAPLRAKNISSVDAIRFSKNKINKNQVLYLVEIKDRKGKSLSKGKIIKQIKSSIDYIERNITNSYTYRFFLAISDTKNSSSISKIGSILKKWAEGLDTPFYEIYTTNSGKFSVPNKIIKCSQTDSLLY